MTNTQWRTGSVCITVLVALLSLAFGGLWEVILPGSAILAALAVFRNNEKSDLYILAAGQLAVYGAAYGSYLTAVICELSLFAAIAGKERIKLLVITFISLGFLGFAAQGMYHTGWWIAGLAVLCAAIVIAAYARKEAISRSMRE